MPSELAHAASKGSLHQLTASLAAHLVPSAITVNCVNPRPTDTGYATDVILEGNRLPNTWRALGDA
jgi:3-oxoacyl-[acyl-carrier protein] reductase